MGLLGHIFQHRHSLRQHAGQHQVHGGAHGHHVQIDLSSLQSGPVGGGADVAVFHFHPGAQGGQALDVLVDGASAQVAAAGHGHLRVAEAAQQRAHQIVAGPDLAPDLIGHRPVADVAAVHLHGGAVDGAHTGVQFLQHVQQQGHIADLGNIFNAANALYQQGGGDNSHSGIFRAADFYFTIKRSPAMDHVLFQGCTSDSRPRAGLVSSTRMKQGLYSSAPASKGGQRGKFYAGGRKMAYHCNLLRLHYSIPGG